MDLLSGELRSLLLRGAVTGCDLRVHLQQRPLHGNLYGVDVPIASTEIQFPRDDFFYGNIDLASVN